MIIGREVELAKLKSAVLFYFRFIDGETNLMPNFWSVSQTTQAVRIWCGLAFERVALQHLEAIKRKLGISGVVTRTYGWRFRDDGKDGDGAQIDLVIERAGGSRSNVRSMRSRRGRRTQFTLRWSPRMGSRPTRTHPTFSPSSRSTICSRGKCSGTVPAGHQAGYLEDENQTWQNACYRKCKGRHCRGKRPCLLARALLRHSRRGLARKWMDA